MFEYEKIEINKIPIIVLKGRIDGLTAPDLDKILENSITEGLRTINLQMDLIKYISSIGLRILLKYQKKLKKIGGEIVLIKPSEMVYDVLSISGFIKLFRVELTEINEEAKSTEEIYQESYQNLQIQIYDKGHSKGNYSIIGDTKKLKTASYTKDDIVEVEAKDARFGLGLSTAGSDDANYLEYFGESLFLESNMLVYPALEKSAVDIIFPSKQAYHFLNGVTFSGEFSSVMLIETTEGFINLEQVANYLSSKIDSKLAGVVFLGESKGMWGMNLKKVPLNATENNIFERSSIMKWLNFPIEPSDFKSLILGVGLISNNHKEFPEIFTNHNFHIHGAFFEDEILNKNQDTLLEEASRLLLEAEVSKIQHLIGKSQFNNLLVGLIELN